MRGNNVIGLIFANIHEEALDTLTAMRTMGSVPFGGKYRLIDFPLSNMVNSGINKVGVITKNNYQSLMDHIGTGKAWDLSRKRDGLFMLPPFNNSEEEYRNRISILNSIKKFLINSKEEYVLISDCDTACNIDYQNVLEKHISNDADITVVYKRGQLPEHQEEPTVSSLDSTGRVKDALINPIIEDPCSFYLNKILMKRELLISLVSECVSKNKNNFKRDIIQGQFDKLKIYGYEFEGFCAIMDSMSSYFNANMKLMDLNIRNDLFNSARPIYTKVRDDMPTRYGLGSNVKNALIGNGCVIEGEVENCVLFKGVHIGKGAKVSNCVIMQDTVIGAGSNLNYVIADKDVVIKDNRSLMGFLTYPVYINKASTV